MATGALQQQTNLIPNVISSVPLFERTASKQSIHLLWEKALNEPHSARKVPSYHHAPLRIFAHLPKYSEQRPFISYGSFKPDLSGSRYEGSKRK